MVCMWFVSPGSCVGFLISNGIELRSGILKRWGQMRDAWFTEGITLGVLIPISWNDLVCLGVSG